MPFQNQHLPNVQWRLAIEDVVAGFMCWPLWMKLGWNDILKRYRRSLLGPFWLTASTGVMVAALGILYANLFNTTLRDFLPSLCVGLLVWNLISSFLVEGGTLFTGAETFIKQVRLPFSVYVFQSTWSKLIIFAHNLIIYFAVLVYFQIWPGMTVLFVVPGLILAAINGSLASLLIGIVSVRFRDVPQFIQSIVQILFFITPIMWKPELLKDKWLLDINPFYHLIEVIREPLLGTPPSLYNYGVLLFVSLVNLVLTGIVFVRFRSRIAYWL